MKNRLTDLTLHSTISAISLPSVEVINSADTIYSTAVNESAINLSQDNLWDRGSLWRDGILASSNRSTNQVATLDPEIQRAYVARSSDNIPTNLSFHASSLGVVAQCTPIASQCFNSSMFVQPQGWANVNASFDCTSAGHPEYVHATPCLGVRCKWTPTST